LTYCARSTDQGLAGPAPAVLVDGADGARGLVLFNALHARVGVEADAARFLRALQQRQVHIGAVDHRIRVAEALAEGLARLQPPDQRLVDGIVHHHTLGVDGAPPRLVAHAQGVERMEGVGAELDARTDLTNLGGLLQHRDLEALPHQGQGRRQAAYAAAGDDDGKLFIACDHVHLRKR
jgi:hypothetical protein